ncbi:uncharacterized protein LOC105768557 isoform X2 [Gossypium raimondii]|uniref:Uncharacterized protein n=1 Tax=Gossypium raimondii TaxID=29730 RepID=A0A0D2U250_GOSRA|nr:uncharacterized protein LOC105768557 isoform X1 [Gossypium raimondii]XP_052486612.1 uncharacterized protein LOC105768557 isoform X2 [Gossypium raimondii]KJB63019.1 hypothetical protein B456_009G449900 [Gossypium raimondii]
MDSSPVHTTSSLHEQEDEWGILTLSLSLCLFAGKILINGRNLDPYQKDRFFINTDGFVIPSLGIEEPYETKADTSDVETSKSYSQQTKKEENIYLGPHGAPPSQSRQQELNLSTRKQRFKQKLKEADKRVSGTGRENKVENLKELVGGGKASPNMSKGSPRDWLDPHCNESEFEKPYPQ